MSHSDTRAAFLADLEADIAAAREQGNLNAVTGLHRLRAQILHLDEERSVAAPADLPEDQLERHLVEIRTMRMDAQGAGSWVAAANLMRQEADALTAIEVRDRDRENRARLADDDDAIIAEIVTLLDSLPPALLDELAEAIERKRSDP